MRSIELNRGLLVIGDEALASNCNLARVDIPDTVTEIGACAFEGDKKLNEIYVPDSVMKIGARAFSICDCETSLPRRFANEISRIYDDGYGILECR